MLLIDPTNKLLNVTFLTEIVNEILGLLEGKKNIFVLLEEHQSTEPKGDR